LIIPCDGLLHCNLAGLFPIFTLSDFTTIFLYEIPPLTKETLSEPGQKLSISGHFHRTSHVYEFLYQFFTQELFCFRYTYGDVLPGPGD
jgi:hypothetical protein